MTVTLKQKPRLRNIGIRFNVDERRAVKRAARAHGETMSAYVRRVAVESARLAEGSSAPLSEAAALPQAA